MRLGRLWRPSAIPGARGQLRTLGTSTDICMKPPFHLSPDWGEDGGWQPF